MKFNFFPIAFDTETTGIDFIDSQVIQVGAIFCDENLKPIQSNKWNINFQDGFKWTTSAQSVHNIPESVAKTHGIEPKEFTIEFEETLKSVYGTNFKPSKCRIVGANSYFDYVMCQLSLWKRFTNMEVPLSHRLIDIGTIGNLLFNCESLSKSAHFFNIKTNPEKLHDALYDAELHLAVFRNQCLFIDKIVEQLNKETFKK